MASVAYPRPWNSGEMAYPPTLITVRFAVGDREPRPTIAPPSRSSTVNCTQPPGSRATRAHLDDVGRTPAGSVRSHPCCRFRPGRCGRRRSSRHPRASNDGVGGVRSRAVRTRCRRAPPQRSGRRQPPPARIVASFEASVLPPDTMATTLPGPRAPRLRPRGTSPHLRPRRAPRSPAGGRRPRPRPARATSDPSSSVRQLELLGKTLGVIPSTKLGVNATSRGPLPRREVKASGAAVATSAA